MFKARHFDAALTLLCVPCYLRYGSSLRNLEEMIAERGICLDHSTIHRWLIRYTPILPGAFNPHKRPVASKWHVDETSFKLFKSPEPDPSKTLRQHPSRSFIRKLRSNPARAQARSSAGGWAAGTSRRVVADPTLQAIAPRSTDWGEALRPSRACNPRASTKGFGREIPLHSQSPRQRNLDLEIGRNEVRRDH